MTALALAPTLLAALALGACSSDDDDAATPSGTSEFNPDLNPEQPPSTTPGGDTTAIAGLWNATEQVTVTRDGQNTTGEDVAYVQISDDGLWSRHDYDADIAGSPEQGNCYRTTGPFTLTPEGGTDYSLSTEEEALDLRINDAGDVLRVDFGSERAVMDWPRTTGEVSVDDFVECTVAPGTQNPDPNDGR